MDVFSRVLWNSVTAGPAAVAAGAPSWRAVVAVAAADAASEPPTIHLVCDPTPSGGWGVEASRVRSGVRRQASQAGAPAATAAGPAVTEFHETR